MPLLPPPLAETAPPQLFLTTGELDRQKGPAVFFLRTTKPGIEVADGSPEQALSFGTLPARAMEGLQVVLGSLYRPMVELESKAWKAGVGVDDSTAEFFSAYSKFGETLGEAVSSLQGGFTLRRPDNLFDIENKAAAFNRAGGEPHIVKAFEDVAEDWCAETEKLLAENDNARAESDDAGPETELEYWRTRMAKFNAITEQLRGRECKIVLGVLGAAKSRVLKRWKLLDNSITDANNEAKDNVKYLLTLDKFIEPLYTGTPTTIIDTLPALLNNIKMMHTIARYYNTTERMTTLFRKITDQMIGTASSTSAGRRRQALGPGHPELMQRLQRASRSTSLPGAVPPDARQAADAAQGQAVRLQRDAIFGKFDLFCRRVEKLIDMFSTVEQFTSLSRTASRAWRR